jgi:signal transduction histidine kinase/CheY-like chemotaxis protein
MPLVLALAGLFVLVYVQALVAFGRTRDRLHGVTVLVLTAMAALFFNLVARHTPGGVPVRVLDLSTIVLHLQPVFTLLLVSLIRPLPRTILSACVVAWAGAATAIWLLPNPRPLPYLLYILTYFTASELCAAGYLAAEVRRRSGSPRARLTAAAWGTGLSGLAILVAGLGSPLLTDHPGAPVASRVVALGAAGCYAIAFAPPRWLRRQWSARTAYGLMARLLTDAGGSPDRTWRCYTELSHEVVDAKAVAVAVFPPTGPLSILALSGELPGVELTEAVRRLVVPERQRKARTSPGPLRYVTITVPLTLHAGERGALALFSRHRSLFSEDDLSLLAELGRQAAVLADRDLLTKELRAAVEALRAANSAKSDFVAAMSHELRTPLNAIIGFSELMSEEERVGEHRLVPAEWIDNVHSSGRHLLGLINDVLDLSKVEAGRVDLRQESLDVAAVVDEAVSPLRPLIDSKRLTLTTAIPALSVNADQLRLRQMLTNLVSNAIKFTPDGGGLFIGAHRAGHETHISVADTGPGIPKADQHRIFEEFLQLGDNTARSAGTGLGLALTRRLAEAHGGRIEVDSQPGDGSRFTLVLPVGRGAAPAGPAQPAPAGAHTGGILVVEDDPAASSLLKTYLDGAGYRTTVVGSGEEAIARVRVVRPDALLLDVILPGMDGWAVLRTLKEDEDLRHIPVVMVSVVEERDVGIALGAVDYFVKPIDRQALLAWLTRHGLVPPRAEPVTVLAVDDDPESLAAVERSLDGQGLQVITASTGREGLARARERHPDLVISNLLLPDPEGFSLVAALHDDPVTCDVPVVGLATEHLSDDDLEWLRGRVLGLVSPAELGPAELRGWLDRASSTPLASR